MTTALQIGEQIITSDDIMPLLVQYQMLPQLAKEIIIDQAIANIECTEEEANIAHQQFYQQQQISSEDQLQAWLQKEGMTPAQLKNLILRKLKLEKFKHITWEDQLESYFLKRKAQLDRIVYSLIRTKDAGIAQELYFRIQEKETSFEELARQYSQGAEAQTGGLVGPVELNVPHPKISQMLYASQPGQLLPPTRVEEWLIILRLEKFITAQLDQTMKKRLLDERFQDWLKEQLQQQVSVL